MPATKLVFLTGAPEVDALDWHDDGLVSSFDSPVRRFLGQPSFARRSTAATTQLSLPLPKWRALSLPAPSNKNDAQNAMGRREHDKADIVAFQGSPGQPNTRDLEHLTFLEHSLAILQNLDSSQIDVPDGTTAFTSESFNNNATFDTDQSLLTSNASLSTYSNEYPSQQIVSFSGPFTDLKRIPTARHLRSIHPQTMTVNCLASVISVQPARTVRLKKRVGEMDVVEVLLGDETRAGFNVSFWIPSSVDSQTTTSRPPTKDGLRDTLTSLRAGDIILLTHIALSDYQNTVSGQSLSRRITRNNTTLTILSDTVTGLSPPVAAKLQRVHNWSRNFIGPKHTASKSFRTTTTTPTTPSIAGNKSRARLELPPDTQTQFSG